MHFCRILANRVPYSLRFHKHRNGPFYGVFRIGVWQTEPELGLFPLMVHTPCSQVYQNRGPAAHVRTGRVHQREVGVNVSQSVSHEYYQQRRTFREAVCEEWARAAAGAPEHRDKPGASSYQQGNPGKAREVM